MKRICVFCGSSPGTKPDYQRAAKALGRALVDRGLGLVYGGAGVGLMREVAQTVFAAEGEVIGVIPASLVEKEVAFSGLPDLRVVNTMHERKAMMADLADGFIALPGGLGTIEELFEVLTWAQLGIHAKPCGILNICGYFDRLIDFVDYAVADNFIRPEHRGMMLIHEDPDKLLDLFTAYKPLVIDKAEWILSIQHT